MHLQSTIYLRARNHTDRKQEREWYSCPRTARRASQSRTWTHHTEVLRSRSVSIGSFFAKYSLGAGRKWTRPADILNRSVVSMTQDSSANQPASQCETWRLLGGWVEAT